MRSAVRIVKREERGAANNARAADGARAVQQSAPEIARVVKGWISESRERRRAETADSRRDVERWRGNANVAGGQQTAIKILLCVLALTAFLRGNDFGSVAAKTMAGGPAECSTFRRSPVEDRFVTVESLRVRYVEAGAGRTVVLIHGNAGSVEDFEFGAVDLLSSEYRVVAADRPGHGGSDRPAGKTATVEFQAELLHRTLSKLGVTQSILVGHSWGGALALAYALKYPDEVSAMVLLAPAAYPDRRDNGLLRATARMPVVGDLSLFLGRAMLGHHMLRRTLDQAFYPQPPSDDYVKLAGSLWLGRRQLRAYVEDEWGLNDSLKKMSGRYPEINIPVVIVIGDKDKIVSPDQNARRLQAALPQSRLIEIKDTGHEIPQTRPESIYTALRLISPPSRRTAAEWGGPLINAGTIYFARRESTSRGQD
jgi:pimeloyl-ACP methyl ester carboxylesterase